VSQSACVSKLGATFRPFRRALLLSPVQVKEIKNGRLAMVSMLGFAAQAAVTGEGPYANWSKHVANPFSYNLLTCDFPDASIPLTFHPLKAYL
jgi:hypothetical protein